MNIVALINAKAGRALPSVASDAEYLREAFQVAGIGADVRVVLTPPLHFVSHPHSLRVLAPG